jgi:hypothetical protein
MAKRHLDYMAEHHQTKFQYAIKLQHKGTQAA